MLFIPILSLILNFDGSLRPPRDPVAGFTRYTPTSQNTDKIVSCSAAILTKPEVRDGKVAEERCLSIGGKLLELLPGMTSADAEYDGLLMGLDEMVSYISNDESIDPLMFGSDNPMLLIRGDCKVIIDQFTKRSVPRKMEYKFNSALKKMQSIKDLYSDKTNKNLSIGFQHVPREDNQLTDAICRLLVNQKQINAVASIYNSISLGESLVSEESTNQRKQSKSKKKSTKNTHFQKALDSICDPEARTLCHSSQLALACLLVTAAIKQKDGFVLDKLADFYLYMSRRWTRIYYYEGDYADTIKVSMAELSTMCRALAESKPGAEDDEALHNDVGERLRNLFGVFTSTDIGDMASSSARAQLPFMDISALLQEIYEEEDFILENWNRFATDEIKRDPNVLESGVWTQVDKVESSQP